jgi:hypothetical protein
MDLPTDSAPAYRKWPRPAWCEQQGSKDLLQSEWCSAQVTSLRRIQSGNDGAAIRGEGYGYYHDLRPVLISSAYLYAEFQAALCRMLCDS